MWNETELFENSFLDRVTENEQTTSSFTTLCTAIL